LKTIDQPVENCRGIAADRSGSLWLGERYSGNLFLVDTGEDTWISAAPARGATPAFGARDVTITLDGPRAGLGVHHAVLHIRSNDPDEPDTRVAVAYTVSDNRAPVIDSFAWADPNPVTLPGTSSLGVAASDPDGDPLTYTWSKVSGPAAVGFSPNGTGASDASAAAFGAAGIYVLRVTVDDGRGGTTTSDVTVAVQARPGDLDGDGVVNAIDLQIVIGNFGRAVADPGCDPRADANGDTVVNALDLQIVVGNFGT
jgi:hypothetical protein